MFERAHTIKISGDLLIARSTVIELHSCRKIPLSGIYTQMGNFSGAGEYPTTEIQIVFRDCAPDSLFEEMTSDRIKGLYLIQNEGILVEYHTAEEACMAALMFTEYLAKDD